MSELLLRVKGLKTYFHTYAGVCRAVDGVDLDVYRGETLGIVGESGCGKSVMGLSILGLVPSPPGRIEGGEILFEGRDLLKLDEAQMRIIRGNKISMIFQEPMTSLNPVFTIGFQIAEVIRLHEGLSKRDAMDRAVELLRMVGIPSPRDRVDSYPHQMSGGMRQRAMIAIALACNPVLMIADEPTTALDVTIQAQILEIMGRLKERTRTAILLVTHDLGVVADSAQRVVVMYAGKIVEQAEVYRLFRQPFHPYTKALMKAIPSLDDNEKGKPLFVIPGMVPSPLHLPEGCKFHNRCTETFDRCLREEPPLFEVEPGRTCRCWHYEDR